MRKEISAYKTIGEVTRLLKLKSKNNKTIPTHTLRFWEKEFKQLKPKILNGRRYYDKKNVKLLMKIQFLLKEQGMTINGVKKILDNKATLKLDESVNLSIKTNILKDKLQNISKIIKDIKKEN